MTRKSIDRALIFNCAATIWVLSWGCYALYTAQYWLAAFNAVLLIANIMLIRQNRKTAKLWDQTDRKVEEDRIRTERALTSIGGTEMERKR